MGMLHSGEQQRAGLITQAAAACGPAMGSVSDESGLLHADQSPARVQSVLLAMLTSHQGHRNPPEVSGPWAGRRADAKPVNTYLRDIGVTATPQHGAADLFAGACSMRRGFSYLFRTVLRSLETPNFGRVWVSVCRPMRVVDSADVIPAAGNFAWLFQEGLGEIQRHCLLFARRRTAASDAAPFVKRSQLSIIAARTRREDRLADQLDNRPVSEV